MPAGAARVGPAALLALIVLVWAVSWPAIKVGVANVPPVWYGCLRYAVATICLFCYLIARRVPLVPPRSDWPLVAVSGVLQMAAYSALTGIALTILPPGRASVLAFSTPLWVVPLAAWRLHEHVSRLALLGVAMGLLGVLTIAAPSLDANGRGEVGAYCMLFGASAAWAVSIVFVRAHRMAASASALAPWQMLIAAALLCAAAFAAEGPMPRINGLEHRVTALRRTRCHRVRLLGGRRGGAALPRAYRLHVAAGDAVPGHPGLGCRARRGRGPHAGPGAGLGHYRDRCLGEELLKWRQPLSHHSLSAAKQQLAHCNDRACGSDHIVKPGWPTR